MKIRYGTHEVRTVEEFTNDIISSPYRIIHRASEVIFWGGFCLLKHRYNSFSRIYNIDHSSKLSTRDTSLDCLNEDDRDYDFVIINEGLIFVPRNISYTSCGDVITCYGSGGWHTINLNECDTKFHNWISRLLLAGIPPRYSWICNWSNKE